MGQELLIVTYFDQVRILAQRRGVELADAFRRAGVAQTTRQRTQKRATTLRLGTAEKVAHAIAELASA